MTDRYAVIGNPIAHSKSPLIHAAFARQTGEAIEYEALLGNPDDFAGDVRAFVAAGGRGLNVTLPFKRQAWELLADCSPRADAAGAVNTLIVLDDGRLRGDNTDGVGLVRDLLANRGFDFTDRRVLLIGAGGAARGVLPALLATGIASLTLANRTADRAVALAAEAWEQARAAKQHVKVSGCGMDAIGDRQFDLILNATSASLQGDVPLLPSSCLADRGWVYDLLYAETPTAFVRWGRERGAAQSLDGLGMLVEQAAESFWLWRGRRPDTAPVIAALRPTAS